MAWVWPARHDRFFSGVRWHGRAGALELRGDDDNTPISCIGAHCAHGDELTVSLSDISFLVGSRPLHAIPLLLGDWNIDLAPTLDNSEAAIQAQLHAHADRRALLSSFAEALALEVKIPEFVHGSPGGPWAEACLLAPLSRIPLGDAALSHTPSLLDFPVVHHSFAHAVVELDWDVAPADHALLRVLLPVRPRCPRNPPRVWRERHDEALSEAVLCINDFGHASAELLTRRLAAALRDAESPGSAADRRRARVPAQARQLYSQAATELDPARHAQLRRQAWAVIRRSWLARLGDSQRAKLLAGRALCKSTKLKNITAIRPAPGQPPRTDAATWRSPVERHFAATWHADFRSNLPLVPWRLAHDGLRCAFSADDLAEAFTKLHRPQLRDSFGVCSLAWRTLFLLHRDAFVTWFNGIWADQGAFSAIRVAARAQGKETATPDPTQIRVLMPLCTLAQVLDAACATVFYRVVSAALPTHPAVFLCGVKHTQVLEAAHGCCLLLEHASDSHGAGALAQSDIRAYYDNIRVIRVLRWAEANGCPRWLAAVIERFQNRVPVDIWAGSCLVGQIADRAVGTLTGSRCAGLLGTIPVQTSCVAVARQDPTAGYHLEDGRLLFQSYVDNLFSAGPDPDAAVTNLLRLEHRLAADWGLAIKPSSRAIMPALGCPLECAAPTDVWPQPPIMDTLGLATDAAGTATPALSKVCRAMWAAFWRHRRKAFRGTFRSPRCRHALLNKIVRPVFESRCAGWAPTASNREALDNVQKRMLAILSPTPRLPDESEQTFYRRRARAIAAQARDMGLWSSLHGKRAVGWHQHLLRERNYGSWASKLVRDRNAEWWQQRRLSQGSSSSFAGRAYTRTFPGRPATRWVESVTHLASNLPLDTVAEDSQQG